MSVYRKGTKADRVFIQTTGEMTMEAPMRITGENFLHCRTSASGALKTADKIKFVNRPNKELYLIALYCHCQKPVCHAEGTSSSAAKQLSSAAFNLLSSIPTCVLMHSPPLYNRKVGVDRMPI